MLWHSFLVPSPAGHVTLLQYGSHTTLQRTAHASIATTICTCGIRGFQQEITGKCALKTGNACTGLKLKQKRGKEMNSRNLEVFKLCLCCEYQEKSV
jgi:hypothetical protein